MTSVVEVSLLVVVIINMIITLVSCNMDDDQSSVINRPTGEATFSVAATVVVFTMSDKALHVVMTREGDGQLELSSGSVSVDERLEESATRALLSATRDEVKYLNQLGAYQDLGRQPHPNMITIAWWTILPTRANPGIRSTNASIRLVRINDLSGASADIAPGNFTIINDALTALRHQLQHTTIATAFWHGPFRVTDLRRVYDAAFDTELKAGNFQRKITNIDGFLEPTGEMRSGWGRSAALYTTTDAIRPLHPPLHIVPSERTSDD